MDGLDSCAVLTAEQRRELGPERPPTRLDGRTDLYRGVVRLCSTRGNEPRVVGVSVTLSVTAGIEVFTGPRPNAEITMTDIRGFPAVLAVPDAYPSFCNVIVDVAPSQVGDAPAT